MDTAAKVWELSASSLAFFSFCYFGWGVWLTWKTCVMNVHLCSCLCEENQQSLTCGCQLKDDTNYLGCIWKRRCGAWRCFGSETTPFGLSWQWTAGCQESCSSHALISLQVILVKDNYVMNNCFLSPNVWIMLHFQTDWSAFLKKIQFLLITGWERMSERRSGTLTLLNCIFSEASYTIVFLLAFFCKHKCHNLLFSGSPRWKRREGNKYCSWICCCRRCTYHVFIKVQLFGLAANYRSTICMPLHKTLLSRYLD